MVLSDGLYPYGPVMELCKKNKWRFMIVLQNKSLKSVRDEYAGLKKSLPENRHVQQRGGGKQRFQWVNDIYHHYDSDKRKTVLHVVTCEEEWHEIDKITGREVTMTSDHARISDKPLNRLNVHKRGNPAARHRQGMESALQQQNIRAVIMNIVSLIIGKL